MYLLKVLDPSENVFAKFALLLRVRNCHRRAEVNPHKQVTENNFKVFYSQNSSGKSG